MVDDQIDTPASASDDASAPTARPRRRAASRPAGPPVVPSEPSSHESPATGEPADAGAKPAKKAATKTVKKAAKKAATKAESPAAIEPDNADAVRPAKKTAKKAAKKTVKKAVAAESEPAAPESAAPESPEPALGIAPLFQAPVEVPAPRRRTRKATAAEAEAEGEAAVEEPTAEELEDDSEGGRKRRRRRGGRGRRRKGEGDEESSDDTSEESEGEGGEEESEGSRRRRRRRRRGSDDGEGSADDPQHTVTRVREGRGRGGDDVSSPRGSTRLEAKKQRRREGREAGRRRAPILTEAEFLARREAVERVMVVRQSGDRTQIAVLEDDVLVEHYVTRGSSSSMVGNVYLGRVQNVLPSMEAAFVDIGRGRNAVLYAGEVNWDAAGLEGQPKRIEFALKSGDPVLVQVTKDPVGQKGARLTSQISLPGRFLVYVPDGSMTGISRKLPENERARLKAILKRVMPEDAGVIVRTASEGAPEDALEQDVARLQAQWEDISARAKTASPPTLLYSEPDLAIKVVRDIFNEDVRKLVVSGDAAWQQVSDYVSGVAPDLADRLDHFVGTGDVFGEYRVDEQLAKALDRKVYLPSGGSLVIDRTEAMTVVDVNTGKFTGQGGNLEQTVTRNNLEAAEEIVRQLRLRDIGGIIVVDFIDMVLESNRDLVLRRLVECLGRDRTKHQVAEVTSLGLVQMTRKRIGSGLLESFSTQCEACGGRGIKVSMQPLDKEHAESPKHRRPANAVDPADVAARALHLDDHEHLDEHEHLDDLEHLDDGTVEPDQAVEEVLEAEIALNEALVAGEPLDIEAPASTGEPALVEDPDGDPV